MFVVGWRILEVLPFRHLRLTTNCQSELKSLARDYMNDKHYLRIPMNQQV